VLTATFRDRLPFRYEIWRASHLALGALAVGMGMHHAVSAGPVQRLRPGLLVLDCGGGDRRRLGGDHPRLALVATPPASHGGWYR
jgi:hypothetical protein